jgi:hypothetical protein
LGPRRCGFKTRPTSFSKRSTNGELPSGRPVRPCSRKARSSSSGISLRKNAFQSPTIASRGATFRMVASVVVPGAEEGIEHGIALSGLAKVGATRVPGRCPGLSSWAPSGPRRGGAKWAFAVRYMVRQTRNHQRCESCHAQRIAIASLLSIVQVTVHRVQRGRRRFSPANSAARRDVSHGGERCRAGAEEGIEHGSALSGLVKVGATRVPGRCPGLSSWAPSGLR